MKKKFNPADKLDLPKPPDGHYWKVYNDSFIGPMMGLYRGHKHWFDVRVEGRSPTERYTDNTACPLDKGLEHAADVIMSRLQNRNDYWNEVRNLYDDKVYLEDLIDTPLRGQLSLW